MCKEKADLTGVVFVLRQILDDYKNGPRSRVFTGKSRNGPTELIERLHKENQRHDTQEVGFGRFS